MIFSRWTDDWRIINLKNETIKYMISYQNMGYEQGMNLYLIFFHEKTNFYKNRYNCFTFYLTGFGQERYTFRKFSNANVTFSFLESSVKFVASDAHFIFAFRFFRFRRPVEFCSHNSGLARFQIFGFFL